MPFVFSSRFTFLVLLATVAGGATAQQLSLDDAIRAAESDSPRLAARRQAIGAADERANRAGALPDPKLRVGIENLPVSGSDSFRWDTDPQTMRRIGVVQEVPNGDKRKAREQRAAAERELESASLVASRLMIRRETATAWFDVYYAERVKGELERLAREIELQRDAVLSAVRNGKATTAEAYAVGVALENVRDRLITQDRAIAKARAQLAAYVREGAGGTLGAAPDTTRLPQSREQLIHDLHTHPELASYEERVRLAQSEVNLERTTKTPDWSVEVLYGQRSPNFSNMVSLMFSIDLPLAAAQRQDRDIAARLAEVEQAQAVMEEASRMHQAELQASLADWDAAVARLARYEAQALPLARERTDATLTAYRNGTGTLPAVIEARRAETETRLSQIGAEAERARAWAQLAYLVPEEPKQ